MGELVNLKEYRALKAEQEAEKEMDETLKNLDEIEMLKNILEGIVKDLPDVKPSIMYIPIEPKLDAFMSKDIDGYLDILGLKLDEDQRPLFPGRDLDIEGFKDWKRSVGIPTSTPEIDDAFRKLEDIDENNNDETDET